MRGPKNIAYRGKFCAVVRTPRAPGREEYDVWRWNLLKRRWVRMTVTACGFTNLADALPICSEIDEESTAALEAIRDGVPALR